MQKIIHKISEICLSIIAAISLSFVHIGCNDSRNTITNTLRSPDELNEMIRSKLVDINLRDEDGKTMLMYAVEYEDHPIIDVLLGNNADVNVVDNNGDSALHYAVRGCSESTIRKLLERHADVDLTNNEGKSVSVMAAIHCDAKKMNPLIFSEIDFCKHDWRNLLPLTYSVLNNNVSMVKKLLGKCGGITDEVDVDGRTLSFYVFLYNNPEIVGEYRRLGGWYDERRVSSWNRAVFDLICEKNGRVETSQLSLEDLNRQDSFGKSVLSYAIDNNKVELVRYLIGRNVAVNNVDKEGASPLLRAAQYNQSEIVAILLRGGANVNIRAKDGSDALVFSVMNKNLELFKTIVQSGADVNRFYYFNTTVLMHAVASGDI